MLAVGLVFAKLTIKANLLAFDFWGGFVFVG